MLFSLMYDLQVQWISISGMKSSSADIWCNGLCCSLQEKNRIINTGIFGN
jgi:hypothetical protein